MAPLTSRENRSAASRRSRLCQRAILTPASAAAMSRRTAVIPRPHSGTALNKSFMVSPMTRVFTAAMFRSCLGPSASMTYSSIFKGYF